ncbi:alpha-tocopherol transfer protein-like [Topomyia yanbarensis]|uniref:alpha-tocopherol transfer protein-like n=1 Tax=Topomyia yanbarensis TaxID=2498891 RepID=UPI00273BC65A|nr:alpha-tocopherol transfer protein-like [Topomyia yanbarensis]
MSIKFNENNHPYVELGGGFGICINRAAYEEDKQLRVNDDLPEETAKAVAEFRRLAESKRNLNLVVDQSNWTVMLYLKCYENDAKRSFALIDYGYRLLYKERGYALPYAQIRHVFEEGLIRYLPECDDDGAVIFIVEMGRRWDPSKISLNEFIAAIRLSGLATMLNPDAQKNGCRVIFDVDGLSMSQISHFTPKSSNFLFDLIENCTPIVTKGMHTVNNGMLYNVLWAILKQFMSKELRQKTYMHGKDWNSLTKHINPRCLPPRYGGVLEAPDCDGKIMAEFLQHYEGYFVEYNSFGYTDCPDSK